MTNVPGKVCRYGWRLRRCRIGVGRCWSSVIQISVPSEAVPARHPRPNLADVM